MGLLFSRVRLSAETGDSTEFLCSGIPENRDDLAGWSSYDDFLERNSSESEILAEIESYLYGEGETVRADENEIAYLTARWEKDDQFLSRHCEYTADSSFFFVPQSDGFGLSGLSEM